MLLPNPRKSQWLIVKLAFTRVLWKASDKKSNSALTTQHGWHKNITNKVAVLTFQYSSTVLKHQQNNQKDITNQANSIIKAKQVWKYNSLMATLYPVISSRMEEEERPHRLEPKRGSKYPKSHSKNNWSDRARGRLRKCIIVRDDGGWSSRVDVVTVTQVWLI